MNWRSGFFRLWLVLSLLWLVGVGVVVASLNQPTLSPEAFVLKDATSGFFKLDNFFDQFDPQFKAAHAQIEFPNSVTLFVTSNVSEDLMKAKSTEFYKTYSEPRIAELSAARFAFWRNTVLVALLPVAAVLIVGMLIGWIAAGFSKGAKSA